jgi:hypothetical protein
MTEYEIADLGVSMTSMVQAQLASIGDLIQQFMTVLFGYIAAAYFVGANMRKRQVWIFTSLYTVFQAWAIIGIVYRGVLYGLMQEKLYELRGIGEVGEMSFLLRVTVAGLLVAALLASLYFMRNVRQPKPE